MSDRKTCTKCGRQFRPGRQATTRKLCYTCRPAKPAGDLGEAEVIEFPGAPKGFADAVQSELDAAGLDGSPAMLLVMAAVRLEAAKSANDFTKLHKAFSEQWALVFGKQAPDSVGAQVVEAIFKGVG